MGGGPKGNGKKARAGLVRAWLAHKGCEADARYWAEEVAVAYRRMLLESGTEKREDVVEKGGKRAERVVKKGMSKEVSEAERRRLEEERDIALGRMLRLRVRYFTDGAVIGSRVFVNEVFAKCRERFGPKRKDGARKMRGGEAAASGGFSLWSMRDLKAQKG